MKIVIRKSTPGDIPEIREIKRITWINTYPNIDAGITVEDIKEKFKSVSTPESKSKIEIEKQRYKNPNIHIYVAEVETEVETEVVGFCWAEMEKGNGRIMAIYLLPEHQHQGVGNNLFRTALESLSSAQAIYVNVVEYNKTAISFYKHHGFVETGKKGVFDSAATLPSGKVMPEIELIKFN